MKKIICCLILLLGLFSCQRQNTASFHIFNPHYEKASREIEQGNSKESSPTTTIAFQQENTVFADRTSPAHIYNTRSVKRQKLSLLQHSHDTIPNDEENYQRKNRINNKNADTALVLGLLAFIPIPLIGILGLVAMGFGIAALNEMHREPYKYKGKGKAIFGIAVGSLIIAGLIAVAVLIMLM